MCMTHEIILLLPGIIGFAIGAILLGIATQGNQTLGLIGILVAGISAIVLTAGAYYAVGRLAQKSNP